MLRFESSSITDVLLLEESVNDLRLSVAAMEATAHAGRHIGAVTWTAFIRQRSLAQIVCQEYADMARVVTSAPLPSV